MIKTASGKEYTCAFCGMASAGVLYVVLLGISMAEAATVFSNSNETIELVYGETRYSNFTVLINLINENGGVRVSLRRPYVGE